MQEQPAVQAPKGRQQERAVPMSSILDNSTVRNAVLPFTVEQYHQLGEAGIVAESTELLRGIILRKPIKSPRHTWLVQFLADWLRESLPPAFFVRQEQPLTLPDSEPEPDIAVIEGSPDDYRLAHPRTARLVMEVAISSVDLDREKAPLYAAAGIEEFWLVLPERKTVEVYTGASSGGYANRQVHAEEETVSVGSLSGLTLELGRLFA